MQIKYKPGIIGENDDECALIGTKEELLALANQIINFVNNPKEQPLLGYDVFQLNQNLTDPLCSTCLDGVVMVKKEQDKEEIINYFKEKINGELPIDWAGRKQSNHLRD